MRAAVIPGTAGGRRAPLPRQCLPRGMRRQVRPLPPAGVPLPGPTNVAEGLGKIVARLDVIRPYPQRFPVTFDGVPDPAE